jgi:hypothetical protein
MDQLHDLQTQARVAEGRRAALKWLGRRLQWERRLAELRPGDLGGRKAA